MPWTSQDASRFSKKANTQAKKERWAAIANSVLKSCMKDGGSQEYCEGRAITQASGVIAKLEEEYDNKFYYLTDIYFLELEEKDDKKTAWIEIFREGKWRHPLHGIIKGDKTLFDDFINNFKNKVLGREIAIDKTHEPNDGAVGWVKELKIFGDRLKALIEFTPWGIDLIENKGFRYFSPEYKSEYIDKENGKKYKNVLFGGGITNRPFLTNLAPIVMSENIEDECFRSFEDVDTFKEDIWTTLEEYIVEKNLSEDEKSKGFIKKVLDFFE